MAAEGRFGLFFRQDGESIWHGESPSRVLLWEALLGLSVSKVVGVPYDDARAAERVVSAPLWRFVPSGSCTR